MTAGPVRHEFVEHVPAVLDEGVLYVSMAFAIVVHNCACGCGNEVVTPLSPTDWELTFNGDAISLYPSVGNWALECRSHYWIVRNQIRWAGDWTDEQIERAQSTDRLNRERHFASRSEPLATPSYDEPKRGKVDDVAAPAGRASTSGEKERLWHRLRSWWSRDPND